MQGLAIRLVILRRRMVRRRFWGEKMEEILMVFEENISNEMGATVFFTRKEAIERFTKVRKRQSSMDPTPEEVAILAMAA